MDRILRRSLLAAVATACSLGCTTLSSSNSFSESSNSVSESSGSVSSISESIGDSSQSSSASSSGGDGSAALERDVRAYTALFVESDGEPEAFVRGVGALCEPYAVVDWQSDPAVLRGIAAGLASSALGDVEIAYLVAAIAGEDAELREGLWAAVVALRDGPPVATLD